MFELFVEQVGLVFLLVLLVLNFVVKKQDVLDRAFHQLLNFYLLYFLCFYLLVCLLYLRAQILYLFVLILVSL